MSIAEIIVLLMRLPAWVILSWAVWLFAGIFVTILTIKEFNSIAPERIVERIIEKPIEIIKKEPFEVVREIPIQVPCKDFEPTPDALRTPYKIDGKWIVIPIAGYDKLERLAEFEFAVMTRAFQWKLGSDEFVEFDTSPLTVESFAKHMASPGIQYSLNKAKELIAVGTASREGSIEAEQERAYKRARVMARLIQENFLFRGKIWQLSLGQYIRECNHCKDLDDTSWQRPLIVVGVMAKNPQTNIGEALVDAMRRSNVLPPIDSYSAFILEPFSD